MVRQRTVFVRGDSRTIDRTEERRQRIQEQQDARTQRQQAQREEQARLDALPGRSSALENIRRTEGAIAQTERRIAELDTRRERLEESGIWQEAAVRRSFFTQRDAQENVLFQLQRRQLEQQTILRNIEAGRPKFAGTESFRDPAPRTTPTTTPTSTLTREQRLEIISTPARIAAQVTRDFIAQQQTQRTQAQFSPATQRTFRATGQIAPTPQDPFALRPIDQSPATEVTLRATQQRQPKVLAQTRAERAGLFIFERTEPAVRALEREGEQAVARTRERDIDARPATRDLVGWSRVLSPVERLRRSGRIGSETAAAFQTQLSQIPAGVVSTARNVAITTAFIFPVQRQTREAFREETRAAPQQIRDSFDPRTPEGRASIILTAPAFISAGIGATTAIRTVPRTRGGATRQAQFIIEERAQVARGTVPDPSITTGTRVIGTITEPTTGIPRLTGSRPTATTRFVQDFDGTIISRTVAGRAERLTITPRGSDVTIVRDVFGGRIIRERDVATPSVSGGTVRLTDFDATLQTIAPQTARTPTGITQQTGTQVRLAGRTEFVTREGIFTRDVFRGSIRALEQDRTVTFLGARQFATAPFQQIRVGAAGRTRVVGEARIGEPAVGTQPVAPRRALFAGDVPELLTAQTPINIGGDIFTRAISPIPQEITRQTRRTRIVAQGTIQREFIGITFDSPQGIFGSTLPIPARPRTVPQRTEPVQPIRAQFRQPTRVSVPQRVRARQRGLLLAPPIARTQAALSLTTQTPIQTPIPREVPRISQRQVPTPEQTFRAASLGGFATNQIVAPTGRIPPRPPTPRPPRGRRRIPRTGFFGFPTGGFGDFGGLGLRGQRGQLRTPSLIAVEGRVRATTPSRDLTGLGVRGI